VLTQEGRGGGAYLCVDMQEGREGGRGLPVCVDLQDWFVQLRYLPVDERLQRLLQAMVVPLQLPLVLLLVRTNQTLVLAQRVLAPEDGHRRT